MKCAWNLLVICICIQSFGIAQSDSANADIRTLAEFLTRNANAQSALERIELSYKIAEIYFEEDQLDSAMYYTRQMGQWFDPITLDPIWNRRYHFQLGTNFIAIAKYDSALLHLHKAAEYRLFDSQHFKSYLKIARIHKEQGDNQRALQMLDFVEKHKQRFHSKELFRADMLKGDILKAIKEYELAEIAYDQALDHLLSKSILLSEDSLSLSMLFNHVGLLNKRMKKFELTLEYYQKALETRPSSDSEDRIGIIYTNIGVILYDNLNQCQKGILYLQKAIQHKSNHYNSYSHHSLAPTYHNLGEAYLKCNKIDSALFFFQKALNIRIPDFNSLDYRDNPTQEQISSSNFKIRIILHFDYKIRALDNLYLLTKNDSIPELIINTFLTLDNVFDQVRRQTHLSSKIDWRQKALPHYQSGVKRCYEFGFTETALHFSEKAKAILLLDDMNTQLATEMLPDSIREKEKDYQARIVDMEENLASIENTEKDLFLNRKLELFSLKNQHESFVDQVERSYPLYFETKYGEHKVSSEIFQQSLHDDEMIIEFLFGDDEIFAFRITNDNFQIIPITIDNSFSARIVALRKYLQAPLLYPNQPDSLSHFNQLYAQSAYEMYKILLKPLEPLTSKINIIGDDILGYIPFTALLKSTPNRPNDVHSFDFLCKSHEIRTNYSLALLQKMEKNISIGEGIISFAPAYRPTPEQKPKLTHVRSEDLVPLLYNQKLSDDLKMKNWSSKIFKGKEAELDSFFYYAPNYKVINFSMHASLNETTPDSSYLVFSNINSRPFLLYFQDIHRIRLESELVTLSACETGTGQLYKGEGIMSLARAFIYAGAKALVTTLWKVNDKSTSIIMSQFYKNAAKGQTKSEALQNAQLKYLENASPAEAHPFYWAPFIIMGDNNPLYKPWWKRLGYLALLIPSFVIFGTYIYYRIKKNPNLKIRIRHSI